MINVPIKGDFNLKNYPLIINAINEAEEMSLKKKEGYYSDHLVLNRL